MYLAIDIGGTKTLVALFSKRGRVIKRIKFKTAQGSKKFVGDLTTVLKNFTKYHVSAVTVAIPGLVQKNYSVSFGNRNWPGIDLYNPIKNLFDCPINFENDANLASLYEGSFYKGKVIFLTFSTGIGGGIVKDGEILPESSKFEPGHKIYEFDGKRLEWEDIAAASALEKSYHIDLATDLRKKPEMQDIASRIALGIPNIVKKYQPDVIVIGGPLGRIFKRFSKYLPTSSVKFVRPRRPLESVIYGCFLYAKREEKRDR
ncbi:ROK family protein [Candidatus Saccharibacteria bacterium]|nr:ROK family protein [Candidatus Saccharibacteria bacterium]